MSAIFARRPDCSPTRSEVSTRLANDAGSIAGVRGATVLPVQRDVLAGTGSCALSGRAPRKCACQIQHAGVGLVHTQGTLFHSPNHTRLATSRTDISGPL